MTRLRTSYCKRSSGPAGRISRGLLAAATLSALILTSAPAPAQVVFEETLEAQSRPRKHQKRKKRPAPLGVSGGNVTDREVGGGFVTCASGTLGALIEKVSTQAGVGNNEEDATQYIVSNNHVMALLNKAKKGDPINQPGLIDKQCRVVPEDFVATLTAYKKLKFRGNNSVDLALAEVIPGAVNNRGKILRIGIPGNQGMEATIGLPVKKAGRTTGLTKGLVQSIGATLNVDFSAAGLVGQAAKVAKFKNQIVMAGTSEPFSSSGDSGSMIYEDVKNCPRAVALLFAGNDVVTVGSPIEKVLQIAGKLKPKGEATLVGCTPAAAAGGDGLFSQPESIFTGASSNAPIHSFEPDRREMGRAVRAQRLHEDRILKQRGVTGIGIGRAAPDSNQVVLKIMVEEATPEILDRIPKDLEGVPTQVLVTGRIKAF